MKPVFKLPALRPLPKSGATVLWVSLGVSVVLLGLLTLVPKKAPLVMFELVAEYLEQQVSRPELSAIALRGATISAPAGCETVLGADRSFAGVVQPPVGSRVAYAWRPDGVAIGIDAPEGAAIKLTADGEAECVLDADNVFFALRSPPPGTPLPLAGATEIGREFGVAMTGGGTGRDLLRAGSFQVFGRSIAPWASDVLYPITDNAISIPAGSRLSVASSAGTERPLFGVVAYTPEGFEISATADANQISLFRPGANLQTERFAFGVFSDFFGDPQIGVIFFFFFIATTVFQIVTSWVGTWREPREAKS